MLFNFSTNFKFKCDWNVASNISLQSSNQTTAIFVNSTFVILCYPTRTIDYLPKRESGKSIWMWLNHNSFNSECTPLSNHGTRERIDDIYNYASNGMLIEATARDTGATETSCIIKRFCWTVHNTRYLEQIRVTVRSSRICIGKLFPVFRGLITVTKLTFSSIFTYSWSSHIQ